ncbi:MAG: hypothetical protein JST92_22060, partial [Deltaproteobacteria bacterium]|nr:hypothetical protein [Deltaproteobacteria bacterium]
TSTPPTPNVYFTEPDPNPSGNHTRYIYAQDWPYADPAYTTFDTDQAGGLAKTFELTDSSITLAVQPQLQGTNIGTVTVYDHGAQLLTQPYSQDSFYNTLMFVTVPLAPGAHALTMTFTSNSNTPPCKVVTCTGSAASQATPEITGLMHARPVAQTIAFPPLANRTYGDAPFVLAATASSGLPISYTVTGPATIASGVLSLTGAGLVTVTASQPGDETHFAAADVTQSFTVAQASLTAVASDASKLSGDQNPLLTGTVTGLVSGDVILVTWSTQATAASPAGAYPITPVLTGDRLGNYLVSTTAGTLTILSSTPVVVAAADQQADEGAPLTVSPASFTDPGDATGPWNVSIDWGDGSAPVNSLVGDQGALGEASHTYTVSSDHTASGAYAVSISVTNPAGKTGTATFHVTVVDLAPVMSPAGTQVADEGAMTAFNLGSFTDSLDGPWTVSVDFGDGTPASITSVTLPGSLGAMSHQYADSGQYTVSVTIADRDGVSAQSAFTAQVMNLAPAGDLLGAPDSSPEGMAIALGASISDASPIDTAAGFSTVWTATKDGAFFASGTAGSFTFTPDDNGTYLVTLVVTDKDGGSATAQKTIAVTNVSPTATTRVPTAVDEGSTFVLALDDASDPSSADTAAGFRYAFDCGTGAGLVDTGSVSSMTCATTNDGTLHVRLQLRDKDAVAGSMAEWLTGSTTWTADVIVNGVAPTARFNVGASTTVTEGAPLTIALESPFDPSAADTTAGLRYSFACDQGAPLATDWASAGTIDNVTCSWSDGPSVHVVRGRILDSGSLFTDYQVTVNVLNAPPAATLSGAPATSVEGNPIALTASATDPSSDDTAAGFGFAWAVTKNGIAFATGAGPAFTFTPDDNGAYAVTLTATDKDGGQGTASAGIAVTNGAPSATFAVSPGQVTSGGHFTLSLTGASDPSAADTAAGFTYAFDCGGGAFVTSTASLVCTAGGTGTYTVRGRITDKDGASHDYAGSVTVGGTAPTASFGGPASVNEGSAATFAFTNASGTGPFRYAFDCNGGTLASATYANSGSAASIACSFDDGPASRTVTGRLFNSSGASTLYSATIAVKNVAPTATLGTSGAG